MTKLFSRFAAATAFAVGTLAFTAPAFADDAPTAPPPDVTITGAASLDSQYRFRGISQSDNKPAVQATATITHKSGFYVSFWGSSATNPTSASAPFGFKSPVYIGGTEIDAYGGWSHNYKGLTVDGGLYGYIYPGFTSANYYEIYGDLSKSYGPVTAKVGVNFAPGQNVFNFNFSSKTHSNTYVYGELSFSPPKTPFTVHSHLGHTGGGFDYGKQYIDYTVGASYKYKALTFDISLVGTNISRSDTDNAFVFPVTAANCGAYKAAACSDFWHRPAKTVAVGSITASF
jgi:uncharacterized protein (TIGR02001 family)